MNTNKLEVKTSVLIPMGSENKKGLFHSFSGEKWNEEHFAVVFGELATDTVPVIRIHSECLTGDVFASQRCDCGPQLNEAVEKISQEGGVLLYLRQEGRGIGLYSKFDAYRLQDMGLDTFEANTHLQLPEDDRDFSDAVRMLEALNVSQCRVITNNPEKVATLKALGIDVIEVIPSGIYLTEHNHKYLKSKADKKNHSIAL
ncbi:GTP cyclohydrolase [Vibrio neptunius]|uniref:GTP cyclohydrolase II n=1 Tax=Vibrio neptunius TaxID=170651 RepID=UPI0005FA26E4|nr:GTP cyclohydrolase II [Vibrio neptunius]KJY87584.1 GTP cyclohydrolase [Vibrio neptunius]